MKSFELQPGAELMLRDVLKDEKPCMVLYRMNMCPHCVAMKPAWDDATQRLKAEPGMNIMVVEFHQMGMLPSSLRNIRGFPTIQVVEKGKVKTEYSGDRSAQSIIDFALAHAKKVPAKPVATRKPSKPKSQPVKPVKKSTRAKKV